MPPTAGNASLGSSAGSSRLRGRPRKRFGLAGGASVSVSHPLNRRRIAREVAEDLMVFAISTSCSSGPRIRTTTVSRPAR